MIGMRQDARSSSLKKNKTPDPARAAFSEQALLLVELWQAGQIWEIREASQGADFFHPVVLELHAKAAYLVLKQEGRQAEPVAVHHFIDCWLSFLFHPSLFYSLSNKSEESEKSENLETQKERELYRLELLEIGKTIVRKYAEQQQEQDTSFIRHWDEDYALLKVLAKVKKEDVELPLYTPALAWQAGIADKMYSLLQEGQEGWREQEGYEEYEEYLAAGAWYSPVGPALLLARDLARKGEAADETFVALKKDFLPKKNKKSKKSKKKAELFFSYGLARLKIACGLHALEHGQYAEAEDILINLLPLPPHTSALEKDLLTALDQDDNYSVPGWLVVTVYVLSELHRHAPSKAVKKTFCSVLTHQAVLLHNTRSIDGQALLHSMEQAIRLNPDDPLARTTLDDARMDAEICSLHQTMSAGKLAQASKIAQKSSYQEVADQFFIFVAQVIEQVEAGDYPDDQSAFFMVRQLLEGALEIDPEHDMIEEISLLVDALEEGLEGL